MALLPEWVTDLRLEFINGSVEENSQMFNFWWEAYRHSDPTHSVGFRLLVLLGVDVDQVDEHGRSSLFTVGSVYLEQWLEAGADPNLIDDRGRTALDQALIDFPEPYDQERLTQLFREYGGKTAKELEEEKNGSS